VAGDYLHQYFNRFSLKNMGIMLKVFLNMDLYGCSDIMI